MFLYGIIQTKRGLSGLESVKPNDRFATIHFFFFLTYEFWLIVGYIVGYLTIIKINSTELDSPSADSYDKEQAIMYKICYISVELVTAWVALALNFFLLYLYLRFTRVDD